MNEIEEYLIWAVDNEIPIKEMSDWLSIGGHAIGRIIFKLRQKNIVKSKTVGEDVHCSNCGKYKHYTEFYISRARKNVSNVYGTESLCKECSSIEAIKKRRMNKDKNKETKSDLERKELKYGKTKKCTICKVEKSIEYFNWKNKKEAILKGECNECRKEKEREYKIKRLKERGN